MEEAIFDEVEGTFVGIDLGTSNTVVSYFKNSDFHQVKFKGKNIIPSALYFETKDKIIYGDKALKKGVVHPEFLLKEFKRDLGTNKKYNFEFIEENNSNDKAIYVIDTNIFIEEPDILDSFSSSALIKIPLKVIDELKYRKSQAETSEVANYALEHIDKMESNLQIEICESHDDLLSQDLDVDKNSNNDNKILSVAKHFTLNMLSHKTILLTNDTALRLKSDSEDVASNKLSEFKNDLANEELNSSVNCLRITPKEATCILLKHVREESEKHIGEEVLKAVITVPANFTPTQIGQVKEAGELAGFEEVAIQKEPVAVGYAYSLEEQDKMILVYDFGGGTFDASILKVTDGTIEVIGMDGDPHLGGADVTKIVSEQIIYEEFIDEHDTDMYDQQESGLSKIDFAKNKQAISASAEQAKIELSNYESTEISIANLISSEGNIVNLQFTLDRKRFEDEISDIRKQSLDVVKTLISNSKVDKDDINEIVMAGGTSLIPSIRNSLEDTLGIVPKQSIDSSLVISRGAVLEAMKCWSKSDTVQDKIIYNDNSLQDFGIGVKDNKFDLLIEAGTELPTRQIREYTTERDDQESLSIEVFQRKKGYINALRTYDKGVQYIDKVEITGLPRRSVNELTINVIFELTKDDALVINVEVLDCDNSLCNEKTLNIVRASDA